MRASYVMAIRALAAGASLALAAGSVGAASPTPDEPMDGGVGTSRVPWTLSATDDAPEAETTLAPMLAYGWSNVLGIDFRPGGSGLEFVSNPDFGTLWCENGSAPRYAYAHMHLPHGSTITHFRMWGQDLSASGEVSAKLRETCLPNVDPASVPTLTELAYVQSSGDSGPFTALAGLSHVVDNHLCAYVAYVQFPSCDATTSVRKLRIQYEQ